MQKVTVGSVKTKSGQGGKSGTWTLVIVTGEDGAEFTSFDKKLTELGKGAVIELEPEITTKDGKTKVNIKEWKLISEGAPPATEEQHAGSGGGGSRGKDIDVINLEEAGRRFRQQVDRVSIERQSIYNGVVAIIPHYAEVKLQPDAATELNGLILEALKWGRQALKATAPTAQPEAKPAGTAASAQKPATTGTGTALPEFKDGVELFNYATKHGWKVDALKTALSVNNPTEIKDVKAAAAVIFGGKAKAKSTDPNDPEGIFNQ